MAYGGKLRAAGAPVTATRYEGMFHGFFSMYEMLDKGKLAIEESAEALRKAFAKQRRASPLLVVHGAAFVARAAEQVAQSKHALADAANIKVPRAIGVAVDPSSAG